MDTCPPALLVAAAARDLGYATHVDITEAQQRVLKLVRLAASAPDSEEARTAAAMACRLIAEHGLLIMKPGDLVQEPFVQPPAPTAPASSTSKKRRKRVNAKAIQEGVAEAAETASSVLNAAGRVATAVGGFRNAIRGTG